MRVVHHVVAAAVVAVALGAEGRASTFTGGASQGAINSSAIVEASGLVASQNNANVLWTENDAGNPNTIYAVDTSGHLLGSYTLSGATNVDWEDITVGPGPVPGVSYLYLATIGDGKPTMVYRVPEPAVYTRQASAPVSVTLTGVEGKQFAMGGEADGESMFIDPANGDIYLGSKESGHSDFYRATQAQFASASAQVMTWVASVPLSKANGASISYDGNQIFVRNQNQFALLYHRAPGQTIAQALSNPSPDYIEVNGKDVEPNAEAIAFDANGKNFYTLSEGVKQPLYKYTRTSADAPGGRLTVLGQGATWRYLAGGAVPAAGWTGRGFNDGAWASGAGQFGYGHGDERTVVSYGGNASQKAPAAFFRTTFTVADPADVRGLVLKLLYDDGAAVYLNGVEVTRQNLAAGAGPTAFATGAIADALQYTWLDLAIDPSLLILGINTLAVEVHGASASDADLRFDLQVSADTLGADFNADGTIGAADLTILNNGFAHHLSGWANGDINGDGVVGADDYALFDRASARYAAAMAGGGALASVPEPAGVAVWVAAVLAAVPGRRRRRGR